MADKVEMKQGDTLDLNLAIGIELGAVVDTIEANVNFRGLLVLALTVTALGSDGTNYNWTLSATSEQTEVWPIGTLDSDLKITYTDDKISHSDSFKISVKKAETP